VKSGMKESGRKGARLRLLRNDHAISEALTKDLTVPAIQFTRS